MQHERSRILPRMFAVWWRWRRRRRWQPVVTAPAALTLASDGDGVDGHRSGRAAGQVSDFTASVQLSLREKVALEMGVAVEAVTLTIEAASVLLTFEVALPASVDADAAKAALATQLADPEAASAFLSTASFVVSVESIEVEPTVGPPPATSSGGNSGSKSVAAGVITLLVAAALVSWWRRRPPWRRPW